MFVLCGTADLSATRLTQGRGGRESMIAGLFLRALGSNTDESRLCIPSKAQSAYSISCIYLIHVTSGVNHIGCMQAKHQRQYACPSSAWSARFNDVSTNASALSHRRTR